MPYRYLKAIDSYMVVKGFLNEINNVVKRQPIEMEQVYTRNLYCKFGCLTIAIGIAIGHYLRNRIKKTKKLSIKNIVRYMKRNKETLCIQKL